MIKKGTGLFDVTMGCYDGAEICQLVGTFVLATITKAMPTASIGLYRDDGLGVLWDTPGSKADRIRKDLIKLFAEMGLKITIQTNLKVADFLDVTLNLSTRSFYPFRKPNDRPIYIHKLSNHPPNIIKNLPASISRRLTDISSDKASFANAKPLYDNALKASGFTEEAEYLEERKSAVRGKRRNRPRKITWFNPPFSQNVATNVGRKFRTLIRKHFPRSSKLYKIFNENTLKISYSCMPNMAAVIRQHNSAVMRGARTVQENPPSEKPCNCRDKDRCPLNGVCQIHSIVYKATVVAGEDQRDYIGLTAQTFKQRFYSHQQSFWDKKYQSSTALSKHIWSLKEKNTNFEIKWEVRKKAMEYQNTTGRCNLCVAEKLAIIRADKKTSLNKRSELVSKCRHENRYYLCNFPPPISWGLYLTCLSTNMPLNTVSSEPHISVYDHLSPPVIFCQSRITPLCFSLCFFPGFISHCSFHSFFLVLPTHPHTLSPQSALPHPLPSLFIQGLVSFVLCICLKIGLGRETFSCNHKSVRLILQNYTINRFLCKKEDTIN